MGFCPLRSFAEDRFLAALEDLLAFMRCLSRKVSQKITAIDDALVEIATVFDRYPG
jgi:hypothetical protein